MMQGLPSRGGRLFFTRRVQLHLRLGKHVFDCLREAFQPVNTGDVDVLHPTVTHSVST
jgi:hypothetical protein